MLVVSRQKYVRMSPRKVRLVVDAIKSMKPRAALTSLQFVNKAAAEPIAKTLRAAIANATNTYKLNEKDLIIKSIEINVGPTFKRGQAVSRGRFHEVKKRTSHITIVLETVNGK